MEGFKMKVKYIINNKYEQDKFTFGKEYQVIADYRKSKQANF